METKEGKLLFRINSKDVLYDSKCSFDENCRYVLNLSLAVNHNNRNKIMFILKNPSTATHKQEDIDNTLKRLAGWTYRKNIHNFTICNLIPIIAKDKDKLKSIWSTLNEQEKEFILKENDHQIRESAKEHDEIICGWGTHGKLPEKDYLNRIKKILEFNEVKNKLFKVGECTKQEYPKHPQWWSYKMEKSPFDCQKTLDRLNGKYN